MQSPLENWGCGVGGGVGGGRRGNSLPQVKEKKRFIV